MQEHVAHEGKNPYDGLKKKGNRTHDGGACTPRLVTHGGNVALTIQQYLHGRVRTKCASNGGRWRLLCDERLRDCHVQKCGRSIVSTCKELASYMMLLSKQACRVLTRSWAKQTNAAGISESEGGDEIIGEGISEKVNVYMF